MQYLVKQVSRSTNGTPTNKLENPKQAVSKKMKSKFMQRNNLALNPVRPRCSGYLGTNSKDMMAVTFPAAPPPPRPPEVAKRETLRFLASIYDPLGMTSPVSLVGKILDRDICGQRIPWDVRVPENLAERSNKLEKSLTNMVQVSRSQAGLNPSQL